MLVELWQSISHTPCEYESGNKPESETTLRRISLVRSARFTVSFPDTDGEKQLI